VQGIHCDEPKYDKPRATFKQCELVRTVTDVTAGYPQVVHLWGWQYRGKDTGYPAVAQVNERLGGYDRLQQLMHRGRELNANITFSDNCDDAYRSSPAWDPGIIARRPDGKPWERGNWAGENSYIVGLAKNMTQPGRRRVQYTCDRYKLRDTTHIDVLSYFPIRNDWEPAHPAGGVKNLVDGRYKMLEEFARRGVDVSSEAIRYTFIGTVSLFWHMPRPAPCPFGGKPIPLMAAIHRHSAVWGEWGTSRPDRVLNCLFSSNSPHAMVGTEVDFASVLDSFYLVRLPWSKLQRRGITIQHFSAMAIAPSSVWMATPRSISIGKTTRTASRSPIWRLQVREAHVSLDKERIVFYSVKARELSFPLPEGWTPSEMIATRLSVDQSTNADFRIQSGRVTLRVPSRVPVIVHRDRKAKTTLELKAGA